MNIRDIEYVLAVDELKSFIKASKKCFVSQPALSMQIQKTEDVLGIKIFERNKKNIITTSEGLKFIEYAREILKNYTLIKLIKNNESEIKIGTIHTVSPYLLPRVIGKLNEILKNTKVFFIEGYTDSLINDLSSGNLDLLIISDKANCFKKTNMQNIIMKDLYEEGFFLCLPSSYPTLIQKENISKSELKNILSSEKLILLEEGNCMTENIKDSLKKTVNMMPVSNFSATSVETIKHMIKLGNGISILPKFCLNPEDADIKTYKMPDENKRKIVIAHRKNTSKQELINKINLIITEAISA